MVKLLLIISVIIIGSKPVYNESFAIVTGEIFGTFDSNGILNASTQISYPKGFNADNSIVLSAMFKRPNANYWKYGYQLVDSAGTYTGLLPYNINLNNDYITISMNFIMSGASGDFRDEFKIILLKLPNGNQAPLLGDVNIDGVINQDDVTAQQRFIVHQSDSSALTFDQFANSDCDTNRDGKIDSADTLRLVKYLDGQIDSL